MAQGGRGRICLHEDFTGFPGGIVTVPDASGEFMGSWGLIGVNEGTITATVDEPNGVVDITTDTGDNDNAGLFAGAFRPNAGGFWMEARVKIPDSVATTRAAVFVGFTETLSKDTPVMPAETATTTTTYNGTGGIFGFVFDSDATTIAWRLVAGDAGAAIATKDKNGTVGTAIGINANATITADKWYLFRLEMGIDGYARGYIGDIDSGDELTLVGENTTALGASDNFHMLVLIENRSGANERLEVDYVDGEAYRLWTA